MPLPSGLVLEETLNTKITPSDVAAPSGLVIENQTIPEIRQAPPKGIMDEMSSFFRDENRYVARAENIYALSEVTGLPLHEVNKNYDVLRKSTNITGINSDPTDREVMQGLLLPGVIAGAAVNPLGTAAGLIAFATLDKVIPTDKLIKKMESEGVSDNVVKTVELADFAGKAFLAGGVFHKAGDISESFMRTKIIEHKLPETVSLTPAHVQDIYQTGELTTSEQKSLWAALELNSFDRRAALEHGVNINVPSEKIVRIVDNPLWAKVKNMFGKTEAAPEVTTTMAGKPAKGPAGLLEAPTGEPTITGEPTTFGLGGTTPLSSEIANVRYGPPGEIHFDFRGETFTAPEPKDILPVGHAADKSWAVRQLLDNNAKPISTPAEVGKTNLRQERFRSLISQTDLTSPQAVKEANFIETNLQAFDKAYNDKVRQEYKTNNPNIFSADVARTVTMEGRGNLTPAGSAERHAGSSAYKKLRLEEALADPSLVDQDVTILAGGSGYGKTGAIRELAPKNLATGIIDDTNVASFDSGKKAADKALASNPEREVTFFYVDRDPIVAFEKGVMPRYLDPNGDHRVVNIPTHLNNIKSKDAIIELYNYYKDNKRVHFDFVGNYAEKGSYTHLTVDELKNKVYNLTKIGSALEKGIEDKVNAGILTRQEADAFLGKSATQQGTSLSSNGSSDGAQNKPQQVIPPTDSVQKLIAALKSAKDVRGQQETLYSETRAKKFAQLQAVRKGAKGEAGFYKELGALKGELPKVEFEAIRNAVGQEDIDALFNQIRESNKIGEWEKINAEHGLAKMFGEEGGRVPTEGELSLLNEVFGKEFTKVVLERRPFFKKLIDAGLQIANIPRSLMASFDLSAPLRQGIFFIGRPKQFGPAFQKQFGAFVSEKAYDNIQDAIISHPEYQLARDSRLSLTDLDSRLGTREEQFMSSWAEKIPLVGAGVRASGRAYIGFLNKLRFDVFVDLVNKADNVGLNPRKDKDLSKAIADFINNATGRGTLPNGLQKSAVTLNSIFFSPRLLFSRLNLLNPIYYVRQKPFVRKEALKSLFSFVGAGLTVLALLKLAGAEVGSEARSSDFGKAKIDNTRLDFWGGFQPLVRVAAQIVTGKYISSTTGKEMTLGEGYRPLTRADIVQRFVEGKLAPIPSFIVALLKQQDMTGKPVSIPKEVGDRFTPMVLQDTYDLAKEDPKLLPASVLGVFGVGVQTYQDKQKKGF